MIERLPATPLWPCPLSTTAPPTSHVQPLFAELNAGGFAVGPQRQPHERSDAAPRASFHGAMMQSDHDPK